MHHVRSVKDVRAKMLNNKATFQQWIGATKRRQVPLCQYHHSLYHQGELLGFELNALAKYNHNMSSDLIESADSNGKQE